MISDPVEEAAKAIHDSMFGKGAWDNYDTWTVNTEDTHDDYRRHARAVLAAQAKLNVEKNVVGRDWTEITIDERAEMVDNIQSQLFLNDGWSSEHYATEHSKYLMEAQSIADRLLDNHFRLVEPWAPTPPVVWEYGIHQAGRVFSLAESDFSTLETWLEAFPLDFSCEYVVRRSGPDREWETA